MATISEALRAAIDLSGKSLYQIAKETGVDYSIISRFYRGERDTQVSNAEKLASFLGLELAYLDGTPVDYDEAAGIAGAKRHARKAAEAARERARLAGASGFRGRLKSRDRVPSKTSERGRRKRRKDEE